ncbi:Ribosomal protein S11, partial [Candidatus Magnetoovum chiemensis]
MPPRRKKGPKKEKKRVSAGVAHVQTTFNNTVITITDHAGNVLVWSSAGSLGFKGSRKGTPYAAQIAADNASKKVIEMGMKSID